MRNWSIAAVVAAATLFSTSIAQAQAERPGRPTSPPNTSECAPGPDSPRPPSNETTGSRPLSERLAESKGVICPPAGVDPGMRQPPPEGGTIKVVPPPGSPGGNPAIQPK